MRFSPGSNAYLMGIKGVAMTALAQCLVDLGMRVEGSDVEEDFVTKDILDQLGIKVKVGFFADHISKAIHVLVYTGAHKGSKNAEVIEAQRLGIPTLSHAEALGVLMEGKKGISVCGVGGKSTTTAMITWIFEKFGMNPSFSVGVGKITGLGKVGGVEKIVATEQTGKYVDGDGYFIVEADEYAIDPGVNNKPRFSYQHPTCIVCTNLAFDHPDIYASFEETQLAYRQFFMQLQNGGCLIVNGDDTPLVALATAVAEEKKRLGQEVRVITVGEGDQCTVRSGEFTTAVGKSLQTFVVDGKSYALTLPLPGKFNAKNGLLALVAATFADIPIKKALTILADFRGTMRRFEYIGKKDGVEFYDDYAHHPSEIEVTLKALRDWYPKNRVFCMFQPHTYSRTKALLNEFSRSFHDADKTYLLDVFSSARETADPTVNCDILAEKIRESGSQAENLHTQEQAVERLKAEVKPGDVVITIGAGDLYHIHELW